LLIGVGTKVCVSAFLFQFDEDRIIHSSIVDCSVQEDAVLRSEGPESNVATALESRLWKGRRFNLDVDGVALSECDKRSKIERDERTVDTRIDFGVEIRGGRGSQVFGALGRRMRCADFVGFDSTWCDDNRANLWPQVRPTTSKTVVLPV
jgi:hypothetical protein